MTMTMNMTEKLAEAAMHTVLPAGVCSQYVSIYRWLSLCHCGDSDRQPSESHLPGLRYHPTSWTANRKHRELQCDTAVHLVFSRTRVGHTVYNISTVDASPLATQHDKLDHCQSNKVTISAMVDG